MGLSLVATLSFVALWVAVLVDVHRTDTRFVRQGPKWCWMIFVALLPILGAMGWMLFGRPFFTVRRDPAPVEPVVGPEDTPEWAAFLAGAVVVDPVERRD
jgi:hypothetical protein